MTLYPDIIYKIDVLDDWQRMADKAAVSQRTRPFKMTPAFFRKALVAKHSFIRNVRLDWTMNNVPFWLACHFRTHEVGYVHDPMMGSQRPDIINPVDYDRDGARQDAPTEYTTDLNIGSFLGTMGQRLCVTAGPEVNELCQGTINALLKKDDPYYTLLAWACRPKCVWLGKSCPEIFKPCGRYPVQAWPTFAEKWWSHEYRNEQHVNGH